MKRDERLSIADNRYRVELNENRTSCAGSPSRKSTEHAAKCLLPSLRSSRGLLARSVSDQPSKRSQTTGNAAPRYRSPRSDRVHNRVTAAAPRSDRPEFPTARKRGRKDQ